MTIRAFLADIDVLVQPLEFINRQSAVCGQRDATGKNSYFIGSSRSAPLEVSPYKIRNETKQTKPATRYWRAAT